MNCILCALNWSCKKQDNFHYLFIFCNLIIKWFWFVFRDIFLIPVLDILCVFGNITDSPVDSALNILQRRFEDSLFISLEYIYHELLELHFWLTSSTTNSYFYGIQWVFCGMEKCLIHWPVIVILKFLNFFSINLPLHVCQDYKSIKSESSLRQILQSQYCYFSALMLHV